MTRLIRHVSVRFWMVSLTALPLSFWALPVLSAWLPGVPGPVMTGGIFIVVGTGLGLGLDILGRQRIRSLIREGALWERAGIRKRAEQKYIRAIRIFDSAWISPWAAKGIKALLTQALARFYLNCGSRHPGLRMAAATYLESAPGDQVLAALWLDRLKKEGRADALDESVLTALADRHFSNPRLALKLIFPFLDLGRVDFSARRLYRNFLDHPEMVPEENRGARDRCIARIHELMGPDDDEAGTIVAEGRRSATLPAGTLGDRLAGHGPARSDIPIRGRADRGREYLRQAGRLPARGLGILSPVVRGGATAGAFCLGRLARLAGKGAGAVRKLLTYLMDEREKVGGYAKILLAGLMGLWLILFVWNTVSHMMKPGSAGQPGRKIEVMINTPFTIQVAAYLKQAHADRYVAALAKKGIAATIKKTGGGGKTWYLVRISEFPDKKRAAEFGNRLKAKKIIDDFFVSNR